MPKYTPKAEIEIDLSHPVEELQHVMLLAAYGQDQHELLKRLDLWLSETLCNIEEAKATEQNKEQTNPIV